MNKPNDEVISSIPFYKNEDVTPKDLLQLAKMILSAVMILFIIGILTFIFTKELVIFEACKTILPPIATLVIGFYFGKTN